MTSQSEFTSSVLRSLRQIIRSVNEHNKQVRQRHKLTMPQLLCLHELLDGGACAAGMLSRRVGLSQATVTGVLDRLEAKELVLRTRDRNDRRQVLISLTELGMTTAMELPKPLEDRFSTELASLSREEQRTIHMVLERIVDLIELHPEIR